MTLPSDSVAILDRLVPNNIRFRGSNIFKSFFEMKVIHIIRSDRLSFVRIQKAEIYFGDVLYVVSNYQNSSVQLLPLRNDLFRWKQETKMALVAKFYCV